MIKAKHYRLLVTIINNKRLAKIAGLQESINNLSFHSTEEVLFYLGGHWYTKKLPHATSYLIDIIYISQLRTISINMMRLSDRRFPKHRRIQKDDQHSKSHHRYLAFAALTVAGMYVLSPTAAFTSSGARLSIDKSTGRISPYWSLYYSDIVLGWMTFLTTKCTLCTHLSWSSYRPLYYSDISLGDDGWPFSTNEM